MNECTTVFIKRFVKIIILISIVLLSDLFFTIFEYKHNEVHIMDIIDNPDNIIKKNKIHLKNWN